MGYNSSDSLYYTDSWGNWRCGNGKKTLRQKWDSMDTFNIIWRSAAIVGCVAGSVYTTVYCYNKIKRRNKEQNKKTTSIVSVPAGIAGGITGAGLGMIGGTVLHRVGLVAIIGGTAFIEAAPVTVPIVILSSGTYLYKLAMDNYKNLTDNYELVRKNDKICSICKNNKTVFAEPLDKSDNSDKVVKNAIVFAESIAIDKSGKVVDKSDKAVKIVSSDQIDDNYEVIKKN